VPKLPCGSRPRLSEARGSGDSLDANTTPEASQLEPEYSLRLALNLVHATLLQPGPALAEVDAARSLAQMPLFHFNDSASLSKLLLDGLGLFLGNALFNVLRRSIHQLLGFLQAQAGDFADGLDHVDLVGADFF